MDNQDGRLWTPRGGVTTSREREVADTLRDYDRDLLLGQRSDGEWVVFLQPRETEQPPFPVLGLGYNLPSREKVQEKLYKADTKKNGRGIYAKMLRTMDANKAKSALLADDQVGVAADHMEHAFRKQGVGNPRIFVPGRP